MSDILLAFGLGAGATFLYAVFLRDLPDLRTVEDYQPPLTSNVLDYNGKLIGIYATECRQLVPLGSLPDHVGLAFVAAEDSHFFEHSGIDYMSIVRAAWVDIRAGGIKQGASTITMQLVKQMLLSPERRFSRKLREMVLARKIESHFSKDEILYLYLNQIYFGGGAWGIGEAAQTYFAKPAHELSISESALLAGLPQRPSAYSPFVNPDLANPNWQWAAVSSLISLSTVLLSSLMLLLTIQNRHRNRFQSVLQHISNAEYARRKCSGRHPLKVTKFESRAIVAVPVANKTPVLVPMERMFDSEATKNLTS